MGVAWWDRYDAGKKIDLTCMRINDVYFLHLPGEVFIEYQLAAQRMAAEKHGVSTQPGDDPQTGSETQAGGESGSGRNSKRRPFVAVAAYSDCGPAYVPLAEHYPQGGYEIGLCVPGRVSGRPYWHVVIVERRDEAERWARRVEPLGKLDLQLGQ